LNTLEVTQDIVLEPADNSRLANLCGQFDEHLRQIERRLNVNISSRGNRFRVTGNPGAAKIGSDVLRSLFTLTRNERLDPERVHVALQETVMNDGEIELEESDSEVSDEDRFEIQTRRKLVRARGANQRAYVKNIREYDLAFGIGPAGTGKTYLAVASAIDALEHAMTPVSATHMSSDAASVVVTASAEQTPRIWTVIGLLSIRGSTTTLRCSRSSLTPCRSADWQ